MGETAIGRSEERAQVTSSAGRSVPLPLVCLIFFFSGGPALIYQLVWQRALFEIYGINVESVTVIVAAFMLGLGLGSLVGGVISKRAGVPLLLVFGAAELGIGLFGVGSLPLFHWVGQMTLGIPAMATGLVTFLLVLVPTLLMGATLPILVAYLVNRSGNVGRSVGLLYFVNTLGSGVACFVAALFLFLELGQSGSVWVAAAINLVVGAVAVVSHVKTRGRAGTVGPAEAPTEPAPTPTRAAGLLPFPLALGLVALCGFISLSYEILWFRVFSFVTAGMAAAFGLMLGAYLAGIAFGSLFARRFCPDLSQGGQPTHIRALALFVVAANTVGFLVAPTVSHLVIHIDWGWTLPTVAVAAAALGATFPLIAHLGVAPGPRAGAQVSYLYLANILGASSGSLLTGFILMDHLSFQGISVLLALLGLALGAALIVPGRLSPRGRALAFGGVGLAALGVVLLANPLFDQLYERLWRKQAFDPAYRFKHVVETKSGVITVGTHPEYPEQHDHVFGGGIYDGVFSVDPIDDQNMIFRAYTLSLLHPNPKRVLSIGVASGSWAQVMANHPQVEQLTLIEINPGYLRLIEQYPVVAGLLKNPKVEMIIDDGRRYLQAHAERYDMIVMNTTYNWRAHASGLLSREFLTEVKQHLLPGGVVLYNTTSSRMVQRTGCTVFEYATRVYNAIACSDSPLDLDVDRWRKVLLDYEIEGKRVVDPKKPGTKKRLDRLTHAMTPGDPDTYLEDRASILKRTEGAGIVTDDNMGTEWSILWARW